jgi:hypothetical protein
MIFSNDIRKERQEMTSLHSHNHRLRVYNPYGLCSYIAIDLRYLKKNAERNICSISVVFVYPQTRPTIRILTAEKSVQLTSLLKVTSGFGEWEARWGCYWLQFYVHYCYFYPLYAHNRQQPSKWGMKMCNYETKGYEELRWDFATTYQSEPFYSYGAGQTF